MAFPKISGFDARSFTQRLYERVRTPNNAQYPIFNPSGAESFVTFVNSVRAVRDAAAATAVFAEDIKNDLDDHKVVDIARHNALSQRVAALEAQHSSPFP
jgi:hypothetical protein